MASNRLRAALALAGVLSAPLAGAEPGFAPQRGDSWRQQQLIDLAEVLGRAHYLRIICVGRADQHWRDYMRTLIEREPQMRRALSDSFNDGYRTEAVRFPDCSPSSRQVEGEVRARGSRIASALSAQGGDDNDE